MRKTIILLTSILTLLAMSSATCKKPLVCTGDCYDLHITGTSVDALTGSPMPNVPMTLYRRSNGSLFSTRRKVIDFQSDANGRFNTTASIDTSVLKDRYYFYAEIRDNPAYVMPTDDLARLFDVTQSPFDNFHPKVYKRQNLVLKLQRVLPGDFGGLVVGCTYDNIHPVYPWNAATPSDIKETTKTVGMAEGLWAYIDVSRNDGANNITFTRDSVFMDASGPKTFVVKY